MTLIFTFAEVAGLLRRVGELVTAPQAHTPLPNIHLPMDSTSQAWGQQVTGVKQREPWLEVKTCRVNEQMDSDGLGRSPTPPPALSVPGL